MEWECLSRECPTYAKNSKEKCGKCSAALHSKTIPPSSGSKASNHDDH